VATDSAGKRIARDELDTAKAAATVRLTPDKTVILADGKSLSYVTVDVVDEHGVTVPDAANSITFSVTGAGTFVGADSGKQDDGEGYTSPTHNAFNGKVLAIVESKDGVTGPATISTSSPGLAPAATTVYSVGQRTRGLVAVQPVYTRALLGEPVNLPAAVTAVYADGATRDVPVRWLTSDLLATGGGNDRSEGVHTITGIVPEIGSLARAVVTVYRAGSVAAYSTAVPVGTPPGLPALVTVLDTDGTMVRSPVTWSAVHPAQYAAPGTFVVTGTVAGTRLTALATVRVTASFAQGRNIGLATSPTLPSADAGYAGAPSEVPAGLLNGVTTTDGWSNFYVKSATNVLPSVSLAHRTEWVSVSWPNAQRLGSVVPYFTISANRVLPSAITVSYLHGTTWLPVGNRQVQFATASNQPTTITFDPVSTTALRLDLTSPAPDTATGFLQITELQVPADEVTYNSDAGLSDLQVDGTTVAGFDAATNTYDVVTGPHPVITATPVDNGSAAVALPLGVPGTAVVTVTSEDRQHTTTYVLNLTRSRKSPQP
jgi:beta-galactosidase